MALQPFVWPWPLFQLLILYTVGRTPWTGDQPVVRPLSAHRTTQTQNKRTQYRHPCLEWDSNPWSQVSKERRQFMPYTAWPLWSANSLFTHLNILLYMCGPIEKNRWLRRFRGWTSELRKDVKREKENGLDRAKRFGPDYRPSRCAHAQCK
jgi:hypothetical protein